MITNLLAVLVTTIVTNTTERVPMVQQMVPAPISAPTYGALYISPEPAFQMVPAPNPDRKWIRTTIKRVKNWEIDCFGKKLVQLDSEETISDIEVEQHIERTEKWVSVLTNDIPAGARFESFSQAWVREVTPSDMKLVPGVKMLEEFTLPAHNPTNDFR